MHAQRTLIVFERAGSWAVALRQALERARPKNSRYAEEADRRTAVKGNPAGKPAQRLIETRSADECLAAVEAARQSMVVLELNESTCDVALELVRTVRSRYPAALPVVVAPRAMAAYELISRELGAVHFVASPRRLADVAELAARHWASLPTPAMGTAESVWSTLPW